MGGDPAAFGGVTGTVTVSTDHGLEGSRCRRRADPSALGWRRRRAMTRRFVLCTTPAQGHTAPLLAVARRLIGEGHDVVFFTTEHYRDKAEATGARFVPFAAEDDAHDLMVANPERESSSKRGVRGVKDDLRRIFIGPLPGQYRDLRAILDDFAAGLHCGRLHVPRRPSPRAGPAPGAPGAGLHRRHAVRVEQPGHRAVRGGVPTREGAAAPAAQRHHELSRPSTSCCTTFSVSPGAGWPRPARPGFPGYFIDLQPKVVDAYLQATVAGFEYPRSDLAPSVRFVGPILAPPSQSFEQPAWWGELDRGRPVVHVTQGTLDNADLGRLLLLTTRALANDNLLVVATTGGPDPEPLRRGLPANVRLERFIPHDLLLPHVDVMVTNGGYGGVQQALANGVPLVVAGDSEDKPEVAARVQWSGTGVNLHTGRPSAAMVGRAVRRVLARDSYRTRARALQDEIAATDPLGTISGALAASCEANDAVHQGALPGLTRHLNGT